MTLLTYGTGWHVPDPADLQVRILQANTVKLFRKPRSSRSPLKSAPLRNPGESLATEFDRLLNEQLVAHVFFATAFLSWGLIECLYLFFDFRPAPVLTILMCFGVVGFAAFRIIRAIPRLKQMKLGIDGEKAVGQYLDGLKEQGYAVFHDIVTELGNIDHAVIGPTGVFAIETKTVSKPSDRDAIVSYDGKTIRVDGLIPDRDPVVQALAVSDNLTEIIQRGTQRNVRVRPVVLYPGWFVEKQPKGCRVWVLAPRAFAAFLQHEDSILNTEETAAIRSTIDSYIRISQRPRRG